jgi:hypothetical protein
MNQLSYRCILTDLAGRPLDEDEFACDTDMQACTRAVQFRLKAQAEGLDARYIRLHEGHREIRIELFMGLLNGAVAAEAV